MKLLGEANIYEITPEHPPLTDEAQRALDLAVDQKLKSGLFLSFFSFTVVRHQLQKIGKLLAKPK